MRQRGKRERGGESAWDRGSEEGVYIEASRSCLCGWGWIYEGVTGVAGDGDAGGGLSCCTATLS